VRKRRKCRRRGRRWVRRIDRRRRRRRRVVDRRLGRVLVWTRRRGRDEERREVERLRDDDEGRGESVSEAGQESRGG
jgi:hypothetical protein